MDYLLWLFSSKAGHAPESRGVSSLSPSLFLSLFLFFLSWSKIKALSPLRLSASLLCPALPSLCSGPSPGLVFLPFLTIAHHPSQALFLCVVGTTRSSFQVQMRHPAVRISVSRPGLLIPSCLVAKLFSEPTHELRSIQEITACNSSQSTFITCEIKSDPHDLGEMGTNPTSSVQWRRWAQRGWGPCTQSQNITKFLNFAARYSFMPPRCQSPVFCSNKEP